MTLTIHNVVIKISFAQKGKQCHNQIQAAQEKA